jgi:hypothetical protein
MLAAIAAFVVLYVALRSWRLIALVAVAATRCRDDRVPAFRGRTL